MYVFNFMSYNEEAEKIGGDYWIFLDATSEALSKDDIFLDNISKIMKEITNQELRAKMKKKIFDLIVEKGPFFNGVNYSLDIFSSDELKRFFKYDFNIRIAKCLFNIKNIQYHISDIISFIDLLKQVNDDEWEYLMITDILNIIKNYPDKSILVNIIEHNKNHVEIYNKLISDYDSYLPEPYKNFLKMKQDQHYIYNKSLLFLNEDIGIDPRIKIAPEIEANIDYNIKIDLDTQEGFEDYMVGMDATVPNGIEITPRHPFHNTKEDIAKFCGLCEAMKDIGYYYSEVSENASGQINLGLDYLDTKEAILIFYEIYGNCEELLYYISNEECQLFRQDVYANSRIKAISEIIGKRILNANLSRNNIIELFNSKLCANDKTIKGLQYKKNSVCLRGDNDEDYRLEFKIPNGGCNYRTWIDNIRLFGKMMEVSTRLADMMKKDYLSSEEEYLLKLKIDLGDNKLSNKEKLVMLMNLLFNDNSIKQIYYNRYISTIKKIKETNSRKYTNLNYTYEPNFDEVEFMEQYISMLDPDYNGNGTIIMYDPETDIMTSNKKK